ncbi:hypothetical protein LQW54_012457 [Pestalotiopsis sp. IQ-011]
MSTSSYPPPPPTLRDGHSPESVRLQKQLAGAMEQVLKLQQATLQETIKVQASLQKFRARAG